MTTPTDPPDELDEQTGADEHDAEDVIAPFAAWLVQQNRGITHDELSTMFHELVASVDETGKAGTITLQVKVAPMKKNRDVLEVTDQIKVSLPQRDRPTSIFYIDRGTGNLVKNDPNQLTFDTIREVPAPTVVKDAGAGRKKKQA